MKVLNVKVLAKRNGPESCGGARKRMAEALTGVHAGRVLSREIPISGADAVEVSGRQHWTTRYGESCLDLTRSETMRMHVHTMYGTREILWSSQPSVGRDRVMNLKGVRLR